MILEVNFHLGGVLFDVGCPLHHGVHVQLSGLCHAAHHGVHIVLLGVSNLKEEKNQS